MCPGRHFAKNGVSTFYPRGGDRDRLFSMLLQIAMFMASTLAVFEIQNKLDTDGKPVLPDVRFSGGFSRLVISSLVQNSHSV